MAPHIQALIRTAFKPRHPGLPGRRHLQCSCQPGMKTSYVSKSEKQKRQVSPQEVQTSYPLKVSGMCPAHTVVQGGGAPSTSIILDLSPKCNETSATAWGLNHHFQHKRTQPQVQILMVKQSLKSLGANPRQGAEGRKPMLITLDVGSCQPLSETGQARKNNSAHHFR